MDSSTPNDTLLLARMAHGDAEALEFFRARHWKSVYGVAYALLADSAAAVHAVSETFLEAFRTAGGFDPGNRSVGSWLMGLARDRALAFSEAHRLPRGVDLTWTPRPPGRRQTAPLLRRA